MDIIDCSEFSKKRQKVERQHDLEIAILLRSANQLEHFIEELDIEKADRQKLNEALRENRQIWSTFLSSVVGKENKNSVEMKTNVSSLGAFVLSQTNKTELEPSSDKVQTLVGVNRNFAEVLREKRIA